LTNTSTATTVYLTGTSNAANANVSLEKVTGVFANMANNSITATTFVGSLSGAATTAGTVTTAAQPNITSVGTLTSLAVSGNATAGNVYANSGTIGASLLTGTLTTAAQPNITSVGTLTSLGVNGNITAANITANTGVFTGNGAGLSNLAGGNVTGQVANALVAGTVYTNAQPNITSVGTLSSLTVTGNINSGNVSTGRVVATGNISGTQLISNIATGTAPLVVTSTTRVSNLNVDYANVADFTNVTTQSSGNAYLVFANALTGNVSETANSAFVANTSNGALYATTFVGTLSGAATTAGTVTTASQPNITSVGTLSSLTVSGNLSSGNANLGNLATANFFQGDGSLLTNISVGAGSYIENGNSEVRVDANNSVRITVAGIANVLVVSNNGANLSGNFNAGNVSATTLSGNLISPVQTAITTLGTLTGLTVNGVSNLGPNSNVIITGGVNGAFLKTDGSGNLIWDTATLVPAQGSNTQVIFNDGGSTYAGNANLTFNKTTGTLSAHGLAITNSGTFGNVYANSGTVRGSLLTGTLTTAAQPNITSVGTLSGLTVTGNINAGNVSGGNLVSANFVAGTLTTAAQPNITSVGTLTTLNVNNSVTAAAFTANTGIFTGNGAGLTNLNGANVTGTVANATYATSAGSATTAGTVTTNAQPNITSVGTLTGLTVNGTINSGRVSINPGTATTNVHALAVLQTWNNSSIQFAAIEADITDSNSAANSLLLDLQVASSSKFAVSKEGNIFFSGTITGNGTGLNSIAGANVTGTVANATNATAVQSNTSTASTVYLVGTATLANGNVSLSKVSGISANMSNNSITATTFVGTLSGSATSAGTATTAGTVTTNAQPNITSVGTLTSLAVTGNVTAGNVAGGNLVSANFVSGTLTTAAQPNITSVGTLGSLTVTNKVTAGQLQGDGGNISNIQGANVSGAVASATSATTATTAGTVTTAAQPNITSVGTLSSLAVTGNVTAGNVYANLGTIGASLLAGTLTTAAQPNVTSVGTLTGLGVNGNITAANITANTGVFTGNGSGLSVLNASNITTGTLAQARLANSSLTVNGTSISLGGSGTITANTTQTLSNGAYITGGGFNGGTAITWAVDATDAATASKIVARDANGSFSANIVTATLNGAATTAGTVTTAAQPNITSTGTLTSLSVTGNLAVDTDVLFVDTVNNRVGINKAAPAYMLDVGGAAVGTPSVNIFGPSTDNNWGGRLRFTSFNNTTINAAISTSSNGMFFDYGGSERVRINNAGNVGIANTAPVHTLSVTGTMNISGNANVGNLGTAQVLATANVTAPQLISNVATGTAPLVVTSTTQVANLNVANAGFATSAGTATTAGTVTTNAQPNITSTGTLTSLTVSGNITAQANVNMSGYVIRSVASGISAAGTVQANATAIANEINLVSTVSSGQGVRLPTAVAGMVITIINTSANTLLVYPHSGGDINGAALNAAYSHTAGATLQYVAPTTADWYTVGATFA